MFLFFFIFGRCAAFTTTTAKFPATVINIFAFFFPSHFQFSSVRNLQKPLESSPKIKGPGLISFLPTLSFPQKPGTGVSGLNTPTTASKSFRCCSFTSASPSVSVLPILIVPSMSAERTTLMSIGGSSDNSS
jgi:hypothetical protein